MSRIFTEVARQAIGLAGTHGASATQMIIHTWLPGLKTVKLGDPDVIIDVKPLSSIQALFIPPPKRIQITPSGYAEQLERYGHASVSIITPFDDTLSPELRDIIQSSANLSKKQFSTLRSLNAHISWFPQVFDNTSRLKETGNKLSFEEQNKLLEPYRKATSYDSVEIKKMEGRVYTLLGRQFVARGQTFERDILMYGNHANYRQFITPVVYENQMLQAVLHMMQSRIVGESLVLDTPSQEATYFGLDILREYMIMSGVSEQIGPIIPEHICTTAVMRVIRENIGQSDYIDLCRKVTTDNRNLPPNIICVEVINEMLGRLRHTPENNKYSP